jgi:hypothetical protein
MARKTLILRQTFQDTVLGLAKVDVSWPHTQAPLSRLPPAQTQVTPRQVAAREDASHPSPDCHQRRLKSPLSKVATREAGKQPWRGAGGEASTKKPLSRKHRQDRGDQLGKKLAFLKNVEK